MLIVVVDDVSASEAIDGSVICHARMVPQPS
jgi:hypothetical protein